MKLSNKHRRAFKYLVEWKIDIDADNPVDAAKQAKRIHLDPESTATVFQVTDTKTNKKVDVDLNKDSHTKPRNTIAGHER